jgi:hypothetical protein
MNSLEKISSYLSSFGPEEQNYDYVCYIKTKLADMQATQSTGETSNEDDQENTDASKVEVAEQDKSQKNLEGELMDGAFRDLDVLNDIEDDKVVKKASPITDFLSKLSNKK